MRLYHAGPGTDSQMLYDGDMRRALLSFSNAGGTEFDFWIAGRPEGADVMVDSGAFAVWSSGARIDLGKYCEWLQAHADAVTCYISLDVIGDWRASAENLRAMLASGLSPVPTFHRGSPWQELDRLASEHRYIALGGMMSHAGTKVHRQTREDLGPYLDACWTRLERHWPVRVHVFGLAAHQWVLERYPFYSADSATVKIGGSLGTYARFVAGTIRWKYWWDDVPETLDGALGDVAGTAKQAARAARWALSTRTLAQFEQYLTRLWEAKGVTWN
jgi:hypothetical protein